MSRRLLCKSFRAALAPVALISTLALTACPPPGNGSGSGNGNGEGDAGPTGDGGDPVTDPCPAGNAGGFSVCQVQNPDSPAHPAPGSTVNLRGVVALTDVFDLNASGTLKGVFIGDVPLKTYGGVLVTFTQEDGFVARRGELVEVIGEVDEFSNGGVGSETRIRATFLQATGGTAEVTPIDVSDPAVLADEQTGEPYEGVLVFVRNVEVTDTTLGFGQWQVTGGLIVDDTLYAYPALQGEVLSELRGVLGYNAFADGGFRLLPRFADDIVSASRPSASIVDLRDPSSDGYVGVPCAIDQSEFNCPTVFLEKMVVTSQTFVVSSSGPLYGFYIADPTALDENDRMLPYSGILVTVMPSAESITRNDYTFEGAENDLGVWEPTSPEAAPKPGDVVSIVGESATFYEQSQIAFTSTLIKEGTVDELVDVKAPQPARFDGTLGPSDPRHPSRLKGGRPAVTATGFERDAVEPDPAVERFEGVLVELVNVSTEVECIDYYVAGPPERLQDFGYWEVTGGVEIGTLFDRTFGGYWAGVPFDGPRSCANRPKCEDSRSSGQFFDSLKGIVNYSFEVYRVNPRTTDDIQPQTLFVAEGTGSCGQ